MVFLIVPTGLKTRGYLTSRLPDAIYIRTLYSRRLESPRLFMFPSLTLSKLLTLGITQSSLVLLSLNRNFQTFSPFRKYVEASEGRDARKGE